MDKPREFCLPLTTLVVNSDFNREPKGIHVIEYSAYEAVCKERDELKTELGRHKQIIAKELHENDGLGMEFTYVAILKDKNFELSTHVEKLQVDFAEAQNETQMYRQKFESMVSSGEHERLKADLKIAVEALEKAKIGLAAARIHLGSLDIDSGIVNSTLEITSDTLAKIRGEK
jgi:hypothetical protein